MRLQVLHIVSHSMRQALAMVVNSYGSDAWVIRELDDLVCRPSQPDMIVSDLPLVQKTMAAVRE